VVPELFDIVEGFRRPSRIRRPKVRREDAENVDKGDLVLDDLISTLLGRYGTEVLVAPRVAADLVALEEHTAEDGGIDRSVVLNLTLASVRADDKEGRLDVVLLQEVEKVGGVDVGPVVKREGDLPGD